MSEREAIEQDGRQMLMFNRLMLGSFTDTYKRWCNAQGVKPDLVKIPRSKTDGFWVGQKDSAKFVMVYCHGGGFVMPGLAQHLDMLTRWVDWSSNRLAVFCVALTLSPDGQYPTQIGECVEALRFVLSLPGRTPDTTLLGGDSAGGNLVIAVLSHVSGHTHPNSKVVRPLLLTGKLHGAILISPWVSSDNTKFKSMAELASCDNISPCCTQYWMGLYKSEALGRNDDDEYTAPGSAPESWWWSTTIQVASLLVTYGTQEIFRDAILSWAARFDRGTGGSVLQLAEGLGEAHNAPLVPRSTAELDTFPEISQEALIRRWIRSRLR